MGRSRSAPTGRRLEELRLAVDAKLDDVLRSEDPRQAGLIEAMRYSVLSGGKRIRPVLCLAAYEAVGGEDGGADSTAAALELIHAYSLVHDDLPCIDDDSERRGRPTTHRAYGEAMAVLVGDALLTLAFELLSAPERGSSITPERRLEVVKNVAHAAGIRGMIGGQVADLEAASDPGNAALIEYVHAHKTGALIAVSVWAGARLGTDDDALVGVLVQYGKKVGFAFQVVDDILDCGERAEPANYAQSRGLADARRRAGFLIGEANEALVPLEERAVILREIAGRILARAG